METNVVSCVFSYRTDSTHSTIVQNSWDKYDHRSTDKLTQYHYIVPNYLRGQLAVGDTVLVHCATGYQLCEVVEINVFSEKIDSLKPIVCKVDLEDYYDYVDKQDEIKALKAHLQAEKKRLESLVTYEVIAEKNPEFKKLLEEFKALGGNI